MLNFCIFTFIIYAVASSVKAILCGNFIENVVMFAKAFKPVEGTNQKPVKKSKIIRIKQIANSEKLTEASKSNKKAA